MSETLGDLRYAVDGLRRSNMLAASLGLTLALGTVHTTAIFTMIDQVVCGGPVPIGGWADKQGRPQMRKKNGHWMKSYP